MKKKQIRYKRNRRKSKVPTYKLVLCGVLLAFLIITLIHITSPSKVYQINQIQPDGTSQRLQRASSLKQAKAFMMQAAQADKNINSTVTNQDGKIVAVAYGIVDFRTKKCTVNTTYTEAESKEKGYTNGCYARDALFIDINETGTKVKFQLSGVIGWVNLSDVTIKPYIPSMSADMTYYSVKHNTLYHHLSMKEKSTPYKIELGKTTLKDGIYYSYDGHYFYSNFQTMSADIQQQTIQQSDNADDPYYFYYQFVSHNTSTRYSENDINTYIEDILNIKDFETSLLYQSGDAFIDAQHAYQVNAIMMLALSENESNYGTSNIARSKNNLFGHAAYDEAPAQSANQYASVKDSIYTHAKVFLRNGYLNQKDERYHGPYFGNKGEGMNVDYASDPYWGEKAAVNYRKFDEQMGSLDTILGLSKERKKLLY